MFTTGAAAERAVEIYLRTHPPAGEPVSAFIIAASRRRDWFHIVQAYIPGDVLAGYLPASALAVASHVGVLIIIVQVCFGGLTMFAVGTQLSNKLARRGIKLRWYQLPKWPLIASALSYIAFSATLPSSGFELFTGFQPFMGTIAVLVVGVFLQIASPLVERSR